MRGFIFILIILLTTICLSFDYLHEDFEGPDFPPTGWHAKAWIDSPSGFAQWSTVREPSLGFTTNSVLGDTQVTYDGTVVGVSKMMLVTPELKLSQGESLLVEFRYLAMQMHYYEWMSSARVELRDIKGVNGYSQLIVAHNTDPGLYARDYSWTTQPVSKSEPYVITWTLQCISGSSLLWSNELWFYLDDIQITKIPARNTKVETKSLGSIRGMYH